MASHVQSLQKLEAATSIELNSRTDQASSSKHAAFEIVESEGNEDNKIAKSKSLSKQLRAARERSKDTEDFQFIPVDIFDRLVTRNAICDELKRLQGETEEERQSVGTEEGRQRIALQVIPDDGSRAESRKIFALLVMLFKSLAILDFLKEGISDSDLPFIFKDEELFCEATGQRILPFTYERREWTWDKKETFKNYQWAFMAPCFQLSCEREPGVHRLSLHDRAVLPFTHGVAVEIEGGFSTIRRVELHPAHFNSHDFSTTLFAVKTLKPVKDAIVAGNKEVQSLIRLNRQNNPNLIRLLGTYQHNNGLHLVFPWADGNLQDVWKKHFPDPKSPARDAGLARWMARQCLGIVLGLQAIHHNPVNALHTQVQGLSSGVPHQAHGRHGDFKPENILWFKDDSPITRGPITGIMKISDFGFLEFRATLSKSQIPHYQLPGLTPTYRAPEINVKETVAPSYDIWSLGCVLLEFVEWYLRGWQGVDDFSKERLKDSSTWMPNYQEDNFFNLAYGGETTKAVAKLAVHNEIMALRKEPDCSDFILDLLNYIEDHLLRMEPSSRAKCADIVKKLDGMYERCVTDATYCVQRRQTISEKRRTDLSELAHTLIEKRKSLELHERHSLRNISLSPPPVPTIPEDTSSPVRTAPLYIPRYATVNRSSQVEDVINTVVKENIASDYESPASANARVVDDAGEGRINVGNGARKNHQQVHTLRPSKLDPLQQPNTTSSKGFLTGFGKRLITKCFPTRRSGER
ncbi:kinase-like protein [Amniculicola lignicola CBS 123094]|uniref:Kinase-like protein n=1 Tax=Amniculicola lignicola CBS 123094 TaxID=1392246 RepID=A0A6A5WRZ7_9PLEO|nr:kinase-like protein [Amniculicola lignicola CBS 123094]